MTMGDITSQNSFNGRGRFLLELIEEEEHQSSMSIFKRYLEEKGSRLSNSADLLPYYALPYIPDPLKHPMYSSLFTNEWRSSVRLKLVGLLDNLFPPTLSSRPQLVKLLQNSEENNNEIMRKLEDPADGATQGDASEPNDKPISELNFDKMKSDMDVMNNRRKCYLLQALRWRLTKTSLDQRDQALTGFIRNDLLDLTKAGLTDRSQLSMSRSAPLLATLHSSHHRVREYAARLINALASLSRGRSYLAQNSVVVRILIEEIKNEQEESITRENFVGALQKLSLRRNMQSIMIKRSVIPWVVSLLEQPEALSDYTLEYAIALCMNLCLRSAVLISLLDYGNIDIVPYVNGALFSVLTLPQLRLVARQLNIESALQSHIKPGQAELNKQFEFIIRRLNSDEPAPSNSEQSGDESEDDEEDPVALESDLDRQDLPPPDQDILSSMSSSSSCDLDFKDPSRLVGEGLLVSQYALLPARESLRRRGRNGSCSQQQQQQHHDVDEVVLDSAGGVLLRPTTPGRRASLSENCPMSPAPGTLVSRHRLTSRDELGRRSMALRDSLATSLPSVDNDITPRASLDNTLVSEVVDINDDQRPASRHSNAAISGVTTTVKPHSSKTRAIVFESRPKLPRTPDRLSPVDQQYNSQLPSSIQSRQRHSPDSTAADDDGESVNSESYYEPDEPDTVSRSIDCGNLSPPESMSGRNSQME